MEDQTTLQSELPHEDDWFPVLRPGDHVDHYEVIKRIGAGAFSIVYRVKDLKNPGLYAALKGFHGTYNGGRFDKECSVVSRLKHRNIVQLFGGGTYLGRRYLVFECLEGETLHAMLRGGPMPWRQAVSYAKSIAVALDYAFCHHERFVHGDIHPNNVMVEKDDSLKVLDFGLARSLRQAEQLPASYTYDQQEESGVESSLPPHLMSNDGPRGAPGFAAPELILDQRADIYSVGMVLYYTLSGGLLPIVKDAGRLSGRHLQEIHAVPPAAANIATLPAPKALRRVIARATDANPQKRYQTPAELLAALQRAELWGKWQPGRRAATWLSLLAGVLCTVLFLYLSQKRVEALVENLHQTIQETSKSGAVDMAVITQLVTSDLHRIDESLSELQAQARVTPAIETVALNSVGGDNGRAPVNALRLIESINGVDLPLVAIPAGRVKQEPLDGSGPAREVPIASFFMGQFEVTRKQWNAVASLAQQHHKLPNEDPSELTASDELPVQNVTWECAVEFCARLSAYTGRDYHLPSDAEWTYAALGGTTSAYPFGSTVTIEFASFDCTRPYGGAMACPSDRKPTGPSPVGSYGVANGFGLYDTVGNMWEWVSDTFSNVRYIRGGAWTQEAERATSAFRFELRSTDANDIGFRVALRLPLESKLTNRSD